MDIVNPTQYLLKNLDKIYNFDLRWTSMITNKPLLFEDLEYAKLCNFIDNTTTQFEIEQFKLGNISDLYHNLETLLVCNLSKYDRIVSYGIMIFYQYVKIGDNILSKNLNTIIAEISITPTRLYCCALTSTKSTKTELEYAWNVKLLDVPSDSELSPLEYNYKLLYTKSKNFSVFMQYSALRCNTDGFRETWINDNTSNRKLSTVCAKFTNKTNAIDDSQLSDIYEYHKFVTKNHLTLLNSLRNSMSEMFTTNSQVNQDDKFAVYCYSNEFYLHSVKFSMKVINKNPQITKEYLANNIECFIAEKYLVNSMQEQVNWCKSEIPEELVYQKDLLTNLLFDMLKNNYREIICIKQMYGGVLSKIRFSGVFGNVYIIEELMFDNRVIKEYRICKGKLNAATYIIEKGYTLFGNRDDIDKLLIDINDSDTGITNAIIKQHYSQYCKPIINHMFDVVSLYQKSKNDIIDVICYDKINREKFNNVNIKTTVIKDENSQANPLKNITKKLTNSNNKSYWRAIQD